MPEDKAKNPEEKAVSSRLGEIFALINMTDLPAMSPHVQELIALANDSKAGSDQLAEVILKDYSLTNKVLQVVNSAYYGLSQKVSSISRAVTIVGFEAIRNMACGVAIFEEFVRSGVEKEGVSKLMTKSFLSGLWSRSLCVSKGIRVQSEEVFICSLLHNLGKVIVCIYLPEVYNLIEERRSQGLSDQEAVWVALGDITLAEIGQEVARFWNMSDKIVASMEVEPPMPESIYDEVGITRSLADFSNRFTDLVCSQEDPDEVFLEYGPFFGISARGAVKLMLDCVDESVGFSSAVRYGVGRLKVRGRLVALEETLKSRSSLLPEKEDRNIAANANVRRGDRDELDQLQREISASLTGAFDLKGFYESLVLGLHKVLGFDRAVVGLIGKREGRPCLLCRFFSGGADREFAGLLESDFDRPESSLRKAFSTRSKIILAPEVEKGFDPVLARSVSGRRVYILPLIYWEGVAGLIYLDLHHGTLSEMKIKALRNLRQYGEMAIKKYRAEGKKS